MEIAERLDRPNLLSLTNTWILCTILLVFASLYGFSFERGTFNTMVGSALEGMNSVDSGGTAIVKTQNFAVYLLSFGCILPFIKPVWSELRRHAFVFSILGWAILSIAWSDNPSTSAVNVLRMTLNLVLVVYLFERYSANDIQRLVMLVGCVAAAGSLLLIVFFPQYGLQSRAFYALGAWEGIFGQKNICGLEMLILLLPAFFVKLTGIYARMLRGAYVAIVLGIILMTRSAGAWIITSLCLGFVALLKLSARMAKKDVILIAVAAAFTLITAGLIAWANFDTFMFLLGKDPTMTGRTVIWAALFRSIFKRPLLGYGYLAFWQGHSGESRNLAIQLNLPDYTSSESGILELWLELGIIGVLLYGAIFVRSARDAIYCFWRDPSPAVLWYISILFYALVANIEGGLLMTPSNLACMLPFIAYVGLRREAQRIRERAAL
jgi:O-antigen ligase